MGTPGKPEKALLFAGLLFSNEDYRIKAVERLEESFGEIAMECPPLEWNFSDYYKEELGEPIFRRFVFFKNLIEQDSLSSIKLTANEIEKKLSGNGKRHVNIDPGYLTPAKLILASTKDYSHRIYLRDGIYAEVTLTYKKGKFIPHINTYKDFGDFRYQRIFALARGLLHLLSRG